ncbi:hypothetical protein PFICI_03920 [Pestalotiopsis fici W106-1]|uniref:Peptidase S9 prolyl oligopeptidase catalytic domain-containing protein n=1 Tax=Pestalotiopsis fici (strain W106-1 / CGMCC3.15140) TaxID=1229662 RepID=W3XIP9_PESFW|nr:uncharacterized protein PFICI_03920 [Pestalotiopsis fici W106-1]ETS85895.1 hypothetical protein PFICI_03920 [Pestalotiopsis fici W106-1]
MKSIFIFAASILLDTAVASPARTTNDVKRSISSQLAYFPAASPVGTGVIICPGGGYSHLSLVKEGSTPAAWLNDLGIDAWVLTYTTTANQSAPLYPTPLVEALDAVEYVKSQDVVTKLGIWGFSAGGHLAAVTVTNPAADLDFGILAYPVISMGEYAHKGSRDNLIGANASAELTFNTSAQNLVSSTTPPTFLFHTADDATVNVHNSLLYAAAMANYSRPFQTLILPDGSHGLGLALDDAQRNWTPELERFITYSI